MTPQDETTIRQWSFSETESSRIITLAVDDSEIGRELKTFGDFLLGCVSGVKLKKDGDIEEDTPCMIVGRQQNIVYRAVPSGKLLQGFLQVLDGSPDPFASILAPIQDQLHELELPVILKLYVATQCPHCPAVARQLQGLALDKANIRLKVVDAEAHMQSANQDNIRSVPTLILDDQFRWSGQVDLSEVLNLCIERDPAGLSAASLRHLIEDGAADRVCSMMVDSDTVFPGLVELLTHPRWSVRLGAMVTVEYLVADAPALADRLGDMLWGEFNTLSEQVQGDAVHVLGEIATAKNAARLRALIDKTASSVVKEAAEEVLDQMKIS